jgi:rhamnosyltransferase
VSHNSVFAVIVTFRPRPQDLENLAVIRPQIQELVVVDNGSPDEMVQSLRLLSCKVPFKLIENSANLGIATALNAGIRWSESHGAKWVALFDQDSRVTDGFIPQMLEDFENQARKRDILLIVPRYRDPETGVERVCGMDEDGGPFVTITSGSLMPVRAFKECGYFREELFIYTVDDEFSLRLRSKGFSIGLSEAAVLLHASGVPTPFKLLNKISFTTTNYRPSARYYMSRNRVWMIRNYGSKYPRWVRGALRSSAIDVFKILVAEKSRWQKLKMIFCGYRDGILYRMGKTVNP